MPSFFLGIDASKGYADFVILDAHQEVVEPAFQLDDTFEGHAQLYAILYGFCQSHPQAQLFAAAESTGGYENNWLEALRRFQGSLPLKAARLNPSPVRDYARAAGQRVTTDAISAENVAGFLIAHPRKVDYQREDALAGLRRQWSFIEQLTKQRTALLNQLESLLYGAHPELVRYLSSGAPTWLLKLVKRYPTAPRLARARAGTLTQIPFLVRERAEELIEAARRSVASAEDPATETVVRETARQVLHLSRLIKAQKRALREHLALPEEVALLRSFGGISDYAAVGLLLEIQCVERFASAKKIAAFFGVHPTFKISGDGIGAMRMSKQGPPRARALLFMVTLRAIQDNPVIAPLYERLLEGGKEKMEAIGACMHKTLRILYGMLKHRTPFDPEIDRRNRQRSHAATTGSVLRRKRRYQRYDEGAPLSRRAQKRRRQQKPSQSDLLAACGMNTSTVASRRQRGNGRASLSREHEGSALLSTD